jgi:tetratricopeptide (TPR) repeat protein
MARRVNTKFLIILTVVVVGLGVIALVIHKLRRGDPDKYIAQATAAVGEQKYDDAALLYKQALSIDGKRADVWIAYGDVQRQLAYEDPENVGRAVRAWQQALELDPNNKEALTRMLAIYQDDSAGGAALSTIEKGREVAQRLLKVDPDNKVAAAALPLFTLRVAVSGAQANTEPEKMIEAVKQLADLSTAHPEDPELAKQATDARMTLAGALGRSQPAEARKAIEESAQLMSASLKAAPASAAMQFQAAKIFTIATAIPDKKQQYQDAAKAALAEAIKIVKPEDEPYADIQIAAARQALAERDREKAEKILHALLEAKPNDLASRQQVAELIATDPAKRRDAIQILEQPIDPKSVDISRFIANNRAELTSLVVLTNLRLDEYAATRDKAEREKLAAAIEDGISKFTARVPSGADNPHALRLRGKFQRAKGDNVAAIQTLNKAVNLMEQQQQQKDLAYYDTLDLLARSYIDTKQTGSARELLTQITSNANLEQQQPGRVLTARLLLARLFIQDRDIDAARTQVDALEKLVPDAPEVMRLRLATLDKEKDKERIHELYAKLPEKTRPEAFDKASIAVQIGDFTDAQRLVSAELAKTPGDPEASVALARVFGAQDDKDKAVAVIADALKAHPDSKLLQLAQKQLANATPEEMRQFRMESIDQIDDPAQRAMQLADLAMADGKPDEALRQLEEAEKASPDNLRVKEQLFNQYLARKRWDDATRCMDALSKADGDQAGGLLYRVRFAMTRAQAAESPAARTAEVEKALEHARELTQRLPEFAQSWLVLGQALQASGKIEEATQRYATALEKQSDNLDAMRGMVECYALLNRPADVKRYIDAALKINPSSPYFLEQSTNYEIAYGDATKAIPPREAFVKRDPENPQAWGLLAQTYLAAYRYKSGKQDEAGAKEMLGKAADTLKQAIAKFPDDQRFYGGYVDVALAMKDAAGAEALLKQFAARDAWKDKSQPQLMMAEFLGRTGKLDDAEALLKSMMAKAPTNIEAQLRLASLLTQRGKVDDALKALQQSNGDNPRVREQLVRLQIAANKMEDADKTIQAALAADPKSVGYQAISGFVSMRRGRWDEANQRLTAALKLDPRNANAQFYLGQLRLFQPTPNVDEAIQHLTAAREAQPDAAMMVDVRVTLAEALRRRGDADGAARELEAALAAQPLNKNIRLALVNIYMPPKPEPQRLGDAERIIREGRELAKDDPDLLRAEAALWLNRGDSTKAIAAGRAAVAAAPKDLGVQRMFLSILAEARDYATLNKEADRLFNEDKQRWWAVMARGIAKRYTSDKDGAVQDFEAALNLTQAQRNDGASQEVINTIAREIGVDEALSRILPRADKEPRWRFAAAQLYQRKGDDERAAETVERLLAEGDKLTPGERLQVLRFAGTLYQTYQPQPQAEKAYQAYLKVLDAEPNDWATLNNMACLVAEQVNPPRPKEALKYSQKAYELMSSSGRRDPLIFDTHGWVLTLNDRPQEGIDLLRQAVALRSFPEGHYHLGEAYMRAAAGEEAQKQLEMAAEMLRQADEKKQPIDLALKARVDAALTKAKELNRSKSANASP